MLSEDGVFFNTAVYGLLTLYTHATGAAPHEDSGQETVSEITADLGDLQAVPFVSSILVARI
jgi:hypothetical protein